MAEPEAANGAEVFGLRLELLVELLGLGLLVAVRELLGARASPFPFSSSSADSSFAMSSVRSPASASIWWRLGAGLEPRRVIRDDSLETEHERVAHLPLGRRRAAAGFQLRKGVVERRPARTTGCERLGGVLVRSEERFPAQASARRAAASRPSVPSDGIVGWVIASWVQRIGAAGSTRCRRKGAANAV